MPIRPEGARPAVLILVTQYELAGAQKVAIGQARYLHARGYPVTLCFFYDKSGDLEALRRSCLFPVLDLGARPSGAGRVGRLLATLGACARFYRLARRATVVETLTHYSNLIGMPIAWLARARVRIASQRNTLSEFPAWFWRLDAALVNSPIVQRMVAVSELTRRFCIEVEGMRAEKLLVIPNGVDTAVYAAARESTDPRAVRAELGLAPDDLLLLTAARLHPQKGHMHLLAAAKRILAVHPRATFVFAGEGDLRPQIQAAIAAAGLGDRVLLLGRRDDVPCLLAAADLFILPSISEGMPNVVLEAMAAGTPVVATAVDGTRELIVDGHTGRLVPPADPERLAEAVISLLNDPAERAALAARARDHVQVAHAEPAMHARLEELIQGLLAATETR